MSNKNGLSVNEKMIRTASVMIALSVAGVCLAIARVSSALLRVAIFAISGLLFMLGILIIAATAIAAHGKKHKRNYILYDKKLRREILPEELDSRRLRARVVEYMGLFRSGKRIYVGEMFSDTPWSIEKMKPLLCYELLYELSEGGEEACAVFLGYGTDCERIFSRYLIACGDADMASRLTQTFAQFGSDRTQARILQEYISSKKEHIEQMMLKYARDNIDSFIV